MLESGQAHGEPRDLTLVLQVPGTAAGVTALAAGHAAAGEGQEDPAGAGRRQLPPGQPPHRCVGARGRSAPIPKPWWWGWCSRAGSILGSLLPAELEALSEEPPRPRYHSVCEIYSSRVIWKNGVILGFAA